MKLWCFVLGCFGLISVGITQLADPDDPGNTIRIKEISILKDNDYISGTNAENPDGTKCIRDLKLLKNVTENDNLTTSYEYKTDGTDETLSGDNLPFCMKYYYTVEGTPARYILYALRFVREKCPRTKLDSDTTRKNFTLYQIRTPRWTLKREKFAAKFTLYADGEPIVGIEGQIEPNWPEEWWPTQSQG